MSATPIPNRQPTVSPSNSAASTTVSGRLSLSIGATREAGASCSARKYASHETPVATPDALTSITADGHTLVGKDAAPILITGATGTLGRAFARICRKRNLAYRLLSRKDMDITDPASVDRALDKYRPWAVVNTAGYVRVDDAERDAERCFRENAIGPAILAAACARHGVHLTTFSSDLVFDGALDRPYVESDAVAPLNVYGRSKAEAELRVQDKHPGALVVHTSAFFGPWDKYNFVTLALQALERGEPFRAARDMAVSPTYVPDLVHACLDLAIDGESGVWHLANVGTLTWAELAEQAAARAGVDASRLEAVAAKSYGFAAPRPRYTGLHSERGILLPSLDHALGRYLELRNEIDQEMEEVILMAESRQA